MGVTVTNLIQGPAVMYLGLFGATEPATVAAAPATGWTDVGGTSEGITLAIEEEYSPLAVDQILENAGATRTSRIARINTSLAEATLESIARAINEAVPGAAVAGERKLTPTTGVGAFNPNYSALLIDGRAPGGFRRRIIVRRALSTAGVEMSYQKAGQTLVPVSFESYFVSDSIAPFLIIDQTA